MQEIHLPWHARQEGCNPEMCFDCKAGKGIHTSRKTLNAWTRVKQACTLEELTQASLCCFFIDLQNITVFTMALKGSFSCIPMAHTALRCKKKTPETENHFFGFLFLRAIRVLQGKKGSRTLCIAATSRSRLSSPGTTVLFPSMTARHKEVRNPSRASKESAP